MRLARWIARWSSQMLCRRPQVRCSARRRVLELRVEPLEDRVVPSVITFDDLPANTTVSSQYQSINGGTNNGVVFLNDSNDPLPVITSVGSLAHSGSQVADVSSPFEFGTPSVLGQISVPSGNTTACNYVGVYVGVFGIAGSGSEPVKLTAYAANGTTVLGTASASIAAGVGFDTLMQVNDSLGRIAYFQVSGTASDGDLGIDDLTFTNKADHLGFSVQPSNTTAGAAINPAVQVKVFDKFGNLITGDNTDAVTLSVATGGGSFASGSKTTVSVVNGIATFTNLVLDMAGTYTLGESGSGGVSGPNSSSFTITPASANHLGFSVQPSNGTAGTAISPAVQVKVFDQFGNLETGDNSDQVSVNIASGPAGFAAGSTNTVTVSGGIAVFSNLVLDTAGTYTLSENVFLDGSPILTGSNSPSFVINPAAADHLGFKVQPSDTTAGAAISPAVQVEVFDKFGNPLTSDNSDQVTLSVASGPGGFTSGSTTTITVSGGIGTFSNLVLDTAGSYTLGENAAGGLTGTNSSSFMIKAAGADHLGFSVQPSNTTVGAAINPVVQVEVFDKLGNLLTSDNSDQVTLSVASAPGGFSSGSTTTVTASGGIATFSNLVLDTAGSYTLAENATGGVAGPNSSSFVVSPAAADHLGFSVQPSNTTAGTAIAPAVKVEVFDKYNNLLTADNSDQVSVSLASGPGTFAGGSSLTATVSGGIATFSNLKLDTAGSYTLGVTATGGLSGPNSGSFTVNPAGLGQLSFSAGPTNTTAGTAIAPAVQVELFDPYGNPLTGDNTDAVTLTIANARGASTFAGGTTSETTTASGGFAVFSNLVVNTASTYTLGASAAGGLTAGPSGSFTISPAAVYSFAVGSSTTQATAGSGFNVSIRARDRYGNTVTTYNGSVTFSCSDGQSVSPGSVTLSRGAANPVVTLYTPDSSVTLTANAGSIRGTSGSLTVNGANGPSTNPTAQYTFTLYVTGGSGNSPQLLVPSFAPLDNSTFTIIAQSEAQAQLDIANQESLLQQQDNLGIGSTITTVDPNTGIGSVMKAPVGQSSFVPDNLTVTRVVPATTPGPAASFALSFPAIDQADSLQQVTVTALDSKGNVATGYTGTVTLSSDDPQFGVPITYTFTPADQGSHTFTVNLDTAGIQTFMVTDTSSTTLTGQGLVDITPATAVSLAINTPSTDTAGSADGVTVTALDAFGNVATGYTGTVSFNVANFGVPNVGLPATYTFTSGSGTSYDNGSHLFPVIFKTTGSPLLSTFDIENAGIQGGQAQVQVSAAPAKLVIKSQPPATVTAGTGFGLVVEAVDSRGNVVSNFNGLVTLKVAVNPGHGTLGGSTGNTLTFQAVNGVADFVGLTLNKAGVGYSLRATSGTVPAATSRAFTVRASTASQFVVTTQPPSKVAAGSLFGLKVAAEDAYGNVVSSFTGSVTLTLASGPSGATAHGRLIVTLVKGVAVFSGLRITQAGTGYSLTASGSLAAATTNLFNVTARAATHLAVTTQPPASVTAGSAFGLVVTALDAYGNVASSFTGKVTLMLSSNPGKSTLSGKVTVQAVAGVITFTDLLLNNAGTGYKLKAKSGSLTLAVTDELAVVS